MEPAERADDGGGQLRAILAAALKGAIRARDAIAASAPRTTLSAIANAESVDRGAVRSPHSARGSGQKSGRG